MTDIFQISDWAHKYDIQSYHVCHLHGSYCYHISNIPRRGWNLAHRIYMWYVKFSQHGTYDISGRLNTAYVVFRVLSTQLLHISSVLKIIEKYNSNSIGVSIIGQTLPFLSFPLRTHSHTEQVDSIACTRGILGVSTQTQRHLISTIYSIQFSLALFPPSYYQFSISS